MQGSAGTRRDTAMTTLPSDEAGRNLSNLIEQVAESHEPVQIQGSASAAVLIAEADWRAIQETLYLVSIPGMRESIREGMATPVDECFEDPGW
jgi:prevent-host-death family protein